MALIAWSVAGCGTSDRDAIREAFVGYYHGLDAGQAERACESASKRYALELARAEHVSRCEDLLEINHDEDDEPQFAHARVGDIRVRGDRATATADFTHGFVRHVNFVRDADRWRYDGLRARAPERPPRPVVCPKPWPPRSPSYRKIVRELRTRHTPYARRTLRRAAAFRSARRRFEQEADPFDARRLLGQTEAAARRIAADHGCVLRESFRDLHGRSLTMDYRSDRIDVVIEDDRLVAFGTPRH